MNTRWYFWFRSSGLRAETMDDINLQVRADYTRFQDARTLALRMSPNQVNGSTIFYGSRDEAEWSWENVEGDQYY